MSLERSMLVFNDCRRRKAIFVRLCTYMARSLNAPCPIFLCLMLAIISPWIIFLW